MTTYQFGMLGVGVMGRNLAWNIADHGFSVAVWNREQDMLEQVLWDAGDWKALAVTGRLADSVVPTTTAFPAVSTAIRFPISSPTPPITV